MAIIKAFLKIQKSYNERFQGPKNDDWILDNFEESYELNRIEGDYKFKEKVLRVI
jgi:hypothetical protein